MSLPFNIRADLTLSYFVILFFNYLQGLHVLPSSIHFVNFKNSFLLNHDDTHDVTHTTGNNMMYTIHPWVFYLDVHFFGRLVVVIDVNPSHGFWTTRLMKAFGHEGK
jgi:hypothetical protein